MSAYGAALAAEMLKARRSRVPLVTFLAVSAAAGIAALFMFVVADPGRAQNLGLLNQKAQLTGITPDWSGLLGFLAQLAAVGDLLLFAFISTWVFGREAADGTLRYLLALPVPRRTIALAKFTVVAGWALATNVWLAWLVLVVGWVMRLPGGGADVVRQGLLAGATAALLMLCVTTPIAFVAGIGRGYLAPLACAVAVLIFAQVAAAFGWGAVIPWSVPAVVAGLVPGTAVGLAGVAAVAITGFAGALSTLAWWGSGRIGA